MDIQDLINDLFYSNDGFWSPNIPSSDTISKPSTLSNNSLYKHYSKSLESIFSVNSYLSEEANELLRTIMEVDEKCEVEDYDEYEEQQWNGMMKILQEMCQISFHDNESKRRYLSLVVQYRHLLQLKISQIPQPRAIGNANLYLTTLYFEDLPKRRRTTKHFVVVTNGFWVQMTGIQEIKKQNFIGFHEVIPINDVATNFQLSVQLYKISEPKNIVRKIQESITTILNKRRTEVPFKHSKMFKLVRSFDITIDDLLEDSKMDMTLNKYPTYQFRLKLSNIITPTKKGYIKMEQKRLKKSEWKNYWYTFEGGILWFYHDKNCTDCDVKIDMRYCTYAKIEDHDNIVVKRVRPKDSDTEKGLKSKNHFTYEKLRLRTHYYHHQFDWVDVFNETIRILVTWKYSALDQDELTI